MSFEPIASKDIEDDDHDEPDEHCVSDTHQPIASQSIATEDEAADDRLQEVVGKAHAAKEAEVNQCVTHPLESIPSGNDRRCDHHEDKEVVDGIEPVGQLSKVHETQHDDPECGYPENDMPKLHIPSLVVEEAVPSQLHSEDEEAKQLGEPSAIHIKPQV